MVDFNNETTISIPAADIERVLIMQKRENYLAAYEDYDLKKRRKQGADTALIGARVGNLFFQLNSMLARVIEDEEDYNLLIERVSSKDAEDIHDAFLFISAILDDIGLTKIDTKKIDRRRVEASNKEKGYK